MGVGVVSGFEHLADRELRVASARVEHKRGDTYLFGAVLHDVVFSLRYDIYPRFLGSSARAALVAELDGDAGGRTIDDFELLRFLGAGRRRGALAQHRVTSGYALKP